MCKYIEYKDKLCRWLKKLQHDQDRKITCLYEGIGQGQLFTARARP